MICCFPNEFCNGFPHNLIPTPGYSIELIMLKSLFRINKNYINILVNKLKNNKCNILTNSNQMEKVKKPSKI